MKIVNSFMILMLLMAVIISCSSPENTDNENEVLDDDQFQEDLSDDDMDAEYFDDTDRDNDVLAEENFRISKKNPVSNSDFLPKNFTALSNGTVLLSGYTLHEGYELWKSDGTSDGTAIVKDLYPGPFSSNPSGFVRVGSQIFFSADIPGNSSVLYKTDGTAEGTVLIRTSKDKLVTTQMIPRDYGEIPVNNHAVAGSLLFFFSTDSLNQPVLMSVDEESDVAETVGTFYKVSSIVGSSGGAVFFIAADKSNEWKLWKYSISQKEFAEVFDFEHSEGMINTINTHQFFDKFVFSTGFVREGEYDNFAYHVFISDGTADGTKSISENIAYEINSASNGVYFLTGSNELIFTNGTEEGTITVYKGTPYEILSFKVLDDKTLLIISHEPEEISEIPILFLFQIKDGTMTPFHTFYSFIGSYTIPVILKYGEDWYMIDGVDMDSVPEFDIVTYYDYLYKLDFKKGTKTKVDSVVNISSSNFRDYIESADVQGGRIWISGNSIINGYQYSGYEIVVSDGTKSGTRIAKDNNVKGDYNANYFFPFAYKDRLYFNAPVSTEEYIKYRDLSDKTNSNVLVSNYLHLNSSFSVFYHDRFFISAYNSSLRKSMLTTLDYVDNTVECIREGYIYDMTGVDKGVLFLSPGESYLQNLYVSDGTETGTVVLKEGNSETTVQSQYLFQNVLFSNGSTSLFAYLDGKDETDLNYEIWATDGTKEKTIKLLDGIHPYFYDFNEGMMCDDTFLILSQTTDSENRNPSFAAYMSKGTPETTHFVMHCEYSQDCKRIHLGCVGNKPLIFKQTVDRSNVSIHEVLSSGTVKEAFFELAGTMLGPSMEERMVSVGKSFFFTLYTEKSGLELWKTDGTQKGTSIVKDINPGRESSNPYFHAFREPYLYFSASNGSNGYELWKSDGTGKNTEMVIDLNLGPASASIEEVAESDGGLVVNGTGSDGCNELWFIPLSD